MKTKILLTAILIVGTMNLYCQMIYVPGDQTTIQAGIDAAVDGDVVLVDTGTYSENINFKGKAITVASHFLIDGDTNYINNTIINGSQASNPDSASTVMFISGEDTTSIISGFTITGGTGLLAVTIPARIGGGIFCKNSGAKITHNNIIDNEVNHNHIAAGGGIGRIDDFGDKWLVIKHNKVITNHCSTTGSLADGGGIAVTGKVIISNNSIVNNHAYSLSGVARGAGLFHKGHNFMPDSIIINQNIIKNNLSESDGQQALGGGIMIVYSRPFITNNTISNNTVFGNGNIFYGGGVSIGETFGEIEFSGNLITENSIPIDTAHIGVGLHIWSPNKTVNIHDNEFTNNIAPMFGYDGAGGGISLMNAGDTPVFIERNIFSGNRATYAGGIYIKFATNISISNNLFANNAANSGGGIGIYENASTPDFHVEIINNTFTENYAETTGGAFRVGGEEGEDIVFVNNIFWENEAGTSGNSIFNNAQSDTIRVFYSNVDNADISGNWTGENNINEDPEFIDDTLFQIDDSSPCFNAGVDTMMYDGGYYACPVTDYQDEPRPSYGGVDIGADEFYVVGIVEFEVQSSMSEVLVCPNPFTTSTTIVFELHQPSRVELNIFNQLGEQIEAIEKSLSQGEQKIIWSPGNLPNGIYYIKLTAGSQTASGKMVLMK